MSQPKLSSYFSTRKRNPLGQGDVLLKKQTKNHAFIDTPPSVPAELDDISILKIKIHALQQERTTRSKSKQVPQEPRAQEEVYVLFLIDCYNLKLRLIN
jgi:hypothetical protein